MINAYKIFTSDTWHNKPKRIRIFPNDFNSRFLEDFSVNITTIIQTDMKFRMLYCKIINFRRGFNFVIFVGGLKQRK